MEIVNLIQFALYIIILCAVFTLTFNYLLKRVEVKLNMPKVLFMAEKGVEMPQKATVGAAGYDFKAHSFKMVYRDKNETPVKDINQPKIVLKPGERVLISTGIKMQIPQGYELQIRSRSGLTLKQGLVVLNAPGTIDSDYLGDIGIIIYNAGELSQEISKGDRICQGVFAKVEEPEFEETFTFEETKRGSDGFGSTGRN